jgi:hypothetical protein
VDADATQLCGGERGRIFGRSDVGVVGPAAPGDLDVGLVAGADVTADVDVVAGEVGLGVEEVEEVASAQRGRLGHAGLLG